MGKRKRTSELKTLIKIAAILVVFGGLYYYLKIHKRASDTPSGSSDEKEYVILENTDSIKYNEIVMYNYNVNINNVAKKFYNSELFWPYIFIENKNEEAVRKNPLDIDKGTILKLPNLSSKQLDLSDSISVSKVKALADSILNID